MPTTPDEARISLKIDGMSCGHCVQAVTRALAAVPGIRISSVSVGTAEFSSSRPGSAAAAIAAVEKAGFPAALGGPAPGGGCGCCGAKPSAGRC